MLDFEYEGPNLENGFKSFNGAYKGNDMASIFVLASVCVRYTRFRRGSIVWR